MGTVKRTKRPRGLGLRERLALAETQAREANADAQRARAMAESTQRAHHDARLRDRVGFLEKLTTTQAQTIDALRKLTEALSAGALHTDSVIEELTDGVRDALKRSGLNLDATDEPGEED